MYLFYKYRGFLSLMLQVNCFIDRSEQPYWLKFNGIFSDGAMDASPMALEKMR